MNGSPINIIKRGIPYDRCTKIYWSENRYTDLIIYFQGILNQCISFGWMYTKQIHRSTTSRTGFSNIIFFSTLECDWHAPNNDLYLTDWFVRTYLDTDERYRSSGSGYYEPCRNCIIASLQEPQEVLQAKDYSANATASAWGQIQGLYPQEYVMYKCA